MWLWLRLRQCFNPRPREGGDSYDVNTGGGGLFQSAPPRRGRPDLGHMMPGVASFNPRPREGGDLLETAPEYKRQRVSIRAPAKGATRIHAAITRSTSFQSAPPRRGRRLSPFRCFNPRPREGGDPSIPAQAPRRDCFNPRPREGGDEIVDMEGERFNPRPREGGDRRTTMVDEHRGFQSAPPRRGRPARRCATVPRGGFNPRPREGGDSSRRRWPKSDGSVSIRAPAKGATDSGKCRHCEERVSIRAPAKGATRLSGAVRAHRRRFNPRPREGGDAVTEFGANYGICFNPRPREGGDVEAAHHRPDGVVSIRAPAKGATGNVRPALPLLFQSAPPRRGRRERESAPDELPLRFNPRPREGGDLRA